MGFNTPGKPQVLREASGINTPASWPQLACCEVHMVSRGLGAEFQLPTMVEHSSDTVSGAPLRLYFFIPRWCCLPSQSFFFLLLFGDGVSLWSPG